MSAEHDDDDDEEDPFTLPAWILAAGNTPAGQSAAIRNHNDSSNNNNDHDSNNHTNHFATGGNPYEQHAAPVNVDAAGFPTLDGLSLLDFPDPAADKPMVLSADDEVVRVQIRQRRTSEKGAVQVLRSAEGDEAIPLAVRSTTQATPIPREVLVRSPWLASCLTATANQQSVDMNEDEWGGDGVGVGVLDSPSPSLLWRSFADAGRRQRRRRARDGDAEGEQPLKGKGEEEDLEDDLLGPSTASTQKAKSSSADMASSHTCTGDSHQVSFRLSHDASSKVLHVGLPSSGIGKLMLPNGLYQCLELAGPTAAASLFQAKSTPVTLLLSHLLWSLILDLDALAEMCREAMANVVDLSSVALVLALAAAADDGLLLRACYWCLKDAFCSATGAPPSWIRGTGTVKLIRGALSYADICSTPLSVLSKIPEEDHLIKFKRWRTPFDGYTLCQVHRTRGPDGAYPHLYELVLDHSEEVVMRAIREDEQSCCRIFSKDSDPLSASEHSKEFLGSVVPNFWGTIFTVFDSGTNVETLGWHSREALELPVKRQKEACVIGYDTNLMGDTPRHIYLDFQTQDGKKHHMENMQPRWDKRLNSYALPFFGRVKKASAKNFQLVVNSDPNTIYLIFGKISKDVFCLDYRAPIAHLEAFGIGLAALAKKRAVS